MKFEWDEAKRASNFEKHRVDFSSAEVFPFHDALERPHMQGEEERIEATALIGDRLHVMVYTWRNGIRRIISFRKANPREAKRYVETQDSNADT